MKMFGVLIENWKAPGKEWWEAVESKPDEPLIEARMQLTLSWNEYHKLLDMCKGAESTDEKHLWQQERAKP